MSDILSFNLSRPLNIVAGTLLVRCDTYMDRRPGAGGYAIIIDGLYESETKVMAKGFPDTDSESLAEHLVKTLAKEVKDRRAVVLTRSQDTWKNFSQRFSAFKLIRVLGYNAYAVCDATRFAHVASIRALYQDEEISNEFLIAPMGNANIAKKPGETIQSTIEAILRQKNIPSNNNPELQKLVQEAIQKAEDVDVATLQQNIAATTSNDIPRIKR